MNLIKLDKGDKIMLRRFCNKYENNMVNITTHNKNRYENNYLPSLIHINIFTNENTILVHVLYYGSWVNFINFLTEVNNL